jgi:lipoate-protein ligase A
MTYFDLSLPTPAENLACDEALLDAAEEQGGPPVLRFWESSTPFVVLGYANKVAEEVNLEQCREIGVPVLRRCSGGGTVVQGPGCLNYSVILSMGESPELQSITGTNQFVMGRTRDALGRALGRSVSIEGHTDLAVGDLKFSGNAQRRKRSWLLFHGTVLLAEFELGLIPRVLRQPPRQPDYRRQRGHEEFVTRLSLNRVAVKEALRAEWKAVATSPEVPLDRIRDLVANRYSRGDWNFSR